MGDLNYLSAMSLVDVIIGNSSSGIIEAPFFQVATVNIGGRQDGRLRAVSVIDCEASISSISVAIKKALSQHFRNKTQSVISPYDGEHTASQIIRILKTVDVHQLIRKNFYDFPYISAS